MYSLFFKNNNNMYENLQSKLVVSKSKESYILLCNSQVSKCVEIEVIEDFNMKYFELSGTNQAESY